MEIGLIIVAAFVGLVCLATFGVQLVILLIYGVMLVFGLLVQVGLALGWCVLWVFKREAAMEAWRNSR